MSELLKCVRELPEMYQPIFGHPDVSQNSSRDCFDRLKQVQKIHDALKKLYGHPLRVLDLGCAQGFFSYSLAKCGAIVHGVDALDLNVAVCNALAAENPQLNVTFDIARIEDVIKSLETNQYDLVLGLSVFHHIIHEKGVAVATDLLDKVADCSGAMIIETALREEPLYWAAAQPNNPRTLFESCAFVHELARNKTHLSSIYRPMYIVSNRYWIFDEHAAGVFNSWTDSSHALSRGTHEGSRRYFFTPDHVIKFYNLDHPHGPYNIIEFEREASFLSNPPKDFPILNFLIAVKNECEGWVVIENKKGKLLSDLIKENIDFDTTSILRSVLNQLSILEQNGLYHDDVRTWNILVEDNGVAHLIDYGSISQQATDCVWPHNIFLSFLIFVRELAERIVDDPDPLRTISIGPYGLPQPYRKWAMHLWNYPIKDWNFQLMYKALAELDKEKDLDIEKPFDEWAKSLEDAVQAIKNYSQHIKYQINQNESSNCVKIDSLEKRIAGLQERSSGYDDNLKIIHLLEQRLSGLQEQSLGFDDKLRIIDPLEQRLSNLQEQSLIFDDKLKIIDLLEQRLSNLQERSSSFDDKLKIIDSLEKQQYNLHEQTSGIDNMLKNVDTKLSTINDNLASIGSKINSLEEGSVLFNQKLQEFKIFENKSIESQSYAHQLQLQIESLQTRVNDLLNSKSWRITYPMRLTMMSLRWIVNSSLLLPKIIIRPLLRICIKWVYNHPNIKTAINSFLLKYFAGIHAHLKLFALNRGMLQPSSKNINCIENIETAFEHNIEIKNNNIQQNLSLPDLSELTPNARSIFFEIKDAIERKGIS